MAPGTRPILPARPSRLQWLAGVCILSACQSGNAPPPAPPPPEVLIVRVQAVSVPVEEEYVAQTEAQDTVEIRARVGGILERQEFTDGATVKRGQTLFVIDRQPFVAALAQARAALAQMQANWLNSRQNLARLKPLLADQAVSQQDLDAAVARERADAANVEAARAQVKTAELNLGYTTLAAPRGGILSKALVKPGALVTAATTLLDTLYSIDPIRATFSISESRMLGLQKELHDPAHPQTPLRIRLVDGTEYRYPGRLDFVDAAVDPRSGTLQMRLAVPNPEGFLRPGQFVRVILAARQQTVFRVPQQAVQEMQGQHSVFVVGADNEAQPREIQTRTRQGNDWPVASGLAAGERVVVEGIQKVKPGSPVKPMEAKAVPPAAARPG